jgi:exonuclease III
MDKRKKMMYLIFVRAIQVQNKQKKYNMQGLNGMTWNNEGFHDPNKNLFVHEIVREQKLDFVALLETRRSNFVVPFLKHLAVGSDFSRFYLPPHRRSRGILIGINSAILLVKRVEMANFWVKIYLRCQNDGFEYVLVPIYGDAQDSHKLEFLSELRHMCDEKPLPMLVGGDFNIIRQRE